ncbi:MAG: hypothetical protein H7Z42_05905 [Roseiflexaceae bacterium]|nr:hypothetical protein [Roseiflexaceae bacterium]
MCGERQRVLLQSRMGESDLVHRAGDWYLLATCDVADPAPQDVDDALGIDLVVTKHATDSDGTIYSGGAAAPEISRGALAHAVHDYLSMLIDQAADSGQVVRAAPQPWAAG